MLFFYFAVSQTKNKDCTHALKKSTPSIAIEQYSSEILKKGLVKDITKVFGHRGDSSRLRIGIRCIHGKHLSPMFAKEIAQSSIANNFGDRVEVSAGPTLDFLPKDSSYVKQPPIEPENYYTTAAGEKIPWTIVVDMFDKDIYVPVYKPHYESALNLKKTLESSSKRIHLIESIKNKVKSDTPSGALHYYYRDFSLPMHQKTTIQVERKHLKNALLFIENNPHHKIHIFNPDEFTTHYGRLFELYIKPFLIKGYKPNKDYDWTQKIDENL